VKGMDKRTKDMIFDFVVAVSIYFTVKYIIGYSQETSVILGMVILIGLLTISQINYAYRKLAKVE
jgi:hypothetical protein